MTVRTTFAIAILMALVVSFGFTMDERAREARPMPDFGVGEASAPCRECLSGYNEKGECVGRNLMGGTHSFLIPGIIAALVCGLGGMIAGLSGGYARGWVRTLTRAVLTPLEAIPRLVLMLLVLVLWDHSMGALGLALGVACAPALALRIRDRIRMLEQSEALRSARAHGLSERRLVLHHILWLSCRGDIVRHMSAAFATMLVVDTSLSFALQKRLSPSEWNWGYMMDTAMRALYQMSYDLEHLAKSGEILSAMKAVHGPRSLLDLLERIGHYAWTHGVPQFFLVVSAIVLVLWAVQSLGTTLARQMERER